MGMTKQKIFEKMIVFYKGSLHDISHFQRVHSYAALIGKLEGLDKNMQDILEIAAIVHDIACPLCRNKFGNADGYHQEEESEELLREFFEEFDLPEEVLERVIFLVCHHHTYRDVDGLDYQILLEADFLVNAGDDEKYRSQVDNFRKNVFNTKTGLRLLNEIYGK